MSQKDQPSFFGCFLHFGLSSPWKMRDPKVSNRSLVEIHEKMQKKPFAPLFAVPRKCVADRYRALYCFGDLSMPALFPFRHSLPRLRHDPRLASGASGRFFRRFFLSLPVSSAGSPSGLAYGAQKVSPPPKAGAHFSFALRRCFSYQMVIHYHIKSFKGV